MKELSNDELRVEVTRDQLPMHCPQPDAPLWNSHPRVFIPLGDSPDGTAACEYCGTIFTLVEPERGAALDDEIPNANPRPVGTG